MKLTFHRGKNKGCDPEIERDGSRPSSGECQPASQPARAQSRFVLAEEVEKNLVPDMRDDFLSVELSTSEVFDIVTQCLGQ